LRTPRHDTAVTPSGPRPESQPDTRPPRAKKRGGAGDRDILAADGSAVEGVESSVDDAGPERRCVLSGERAPRDLLIRLALGPDGSVAPDIRAKAPGRGAWIGVAKDTLQTALDKGKLKGALIRAFKTSQIIIPDDLVQRIEDALRKQALDRLGLEARSGTLLTGGDRIADAARKGTVRLLIHALDAGADGKRKLDQLWRVGRDMEGSDLKGMVAPLSRELLSMALGRENVVHIAMIAPAAATRVSGALQRWQNFVGKTMGTGEPEDKSSGESGFDVENEG